MKNNIDAIRENNLFRNLIKLMYLKELKKSELINDKDYAKLELKYLKGDAINGEKSNICER